jgi:hypothetical protein
MIMNSEGVSMISMNNVNGVSMMSMNSEGVSMISRNRLIDYEQ